MVFYNFDINRWPIVILTIKGSPTSDKDMTGFLKQWESLYHISMEKNERYKLIFDTRDASMIKIPYIRQMGKWLVKMKSLTETWMDRTAIIVSNPSIQLLIQFVFKIYKAVSCIINGFINFDTI